MTSPRDEFLSKISALIEDYENVNEVVIGAYLTFGGSADNSDSDMVWEWDGRGFSPHGYIEIRVKPRAQAEVVPTNRRGVTGNR